MPNNVANVADLVSIEDIRGNSVIMKDGSLRNVVIVGGVNFSLKSEMEQNVLTQAYQNFLNGLNFPIQILVHSRKINIDKYLAALDEHRVSETAPLLQNQIAEYEEFIRSFVRENAIMAKTFFVVVPFTPVKLPGKSAILKFLPFRKKDVVEKSEEGERTRAFEEGIGQLRQRTAQVMEGLAVIGLEAALLDEKSLVELFYNFYNPESVEKKWSKIAR